MSSAAREPRCARVVFLGAGGVGKSALIRRFLHGRFEPRHARTVEELHALEYDGDGGARARLEILDTSGSYAFPAMRALCLRTGDAFALVYSAAEPRETFEEVQRLRDEIAEARGQAFAAITVVENKADARERNRAVTAEAARAAEEEWGARFIAASALTGDNVAAVFQDLLEQAELPPGRRTREATLKKRDSCSVS